MNSHRISNSHPSQITSLKFQTQQAFIYAGAYYYQISVSRFYEKQAELDDMQILKLTERLSIVGRLHINRFKNLINIFSILGIFFVFSLVLSFTIIHIQNLTAISTLFFFIGLAGASYSVFHYISCPLIDFTVLYRNFCKLNNPNALFEQDDSDVTLNT